MIIKCNYPFMLQKKIFFNFNGINFHSEYKDEIPYPLYSFSVISPELTDHAFSTRILSFDLTYDNIISNSCWRVSNKQKYNPEEDRNLPQDLLSKNGHQRYHTSIRLQNKQRGKYWFYPQDIGRPGFKFHVPSRILLYQIKIDNLFYNIILGKTFISLGMKRNSELLTVLYSLPEDMIKMLRNGR